MHEHTNPPKSLFKVFHFSNAPRGNTLNPCNNVVSTDINNTSIRHHALVRIRCMFGGVGVLLCWLISMTGNRLPIQHAIFHHINTKYSQLFLSLIVLLKSPKLHDSCSLTSLYTWTNVCSFKQRRIVHGRSLPEHKHNLNQHSAAAPQMCPLVITHTQFV